MVAGIKRIIHAKLLVPWALLMLLLLRVLRTERRNMSTKEHRGRWMLMDGVGRMDITARGTIPQQPCVKQQPVDGAPDEKRISVSFL